jgi:hypothetical protein
MHSLMTRTSSALLTDTEELRYEERLSGEEASGQVRKDVE